MMISSSWLRSSSHNWAWQQGAQATRHFTTLFSFSVFANRTSPLYSATTKIVDSDSQSAQSPHHDDDLKQQLVDNQTCSVSSTEVDSTTDDFKERHFPDLSPLAQQRIPTSVPLMYCPPPLLQASSLIYPFSAAALLGSRFPFITMVPAATVTPAATSAAQQLSPASVIPVTMGNRQLENIHQYQRQSSISSTSSVCESPKLVDVNDVTCNDNVMDSQESEGICSYAELRQFADDFKAKRIKLGYTQGGVGLSLAEKGFSNFAQSTISRFEQMQLSPRNAAAIKKILEKWLIEVENPHLKMHRSSDKLNCRKRKRRIVFSTESKKFLEDMFNCNPKPDRHTIEMIAKELSLLPEEVRIWFCNKRQKERSGSRSGLSYASSSSPGSSAESQGHTRSPSPPSNFSVEELSKSSCNSPQSCSAYDSPVCSPQYQLLNFANVSSTTTSSNCKSSPAASPV